MGSNIDALIAGGIRPPQVEDPATNAMRLMQMRDMQQRAAYQGQLSQLAGMRVQQMQRDQADDQTVQAALGQSNGDLGQALPMLAGKIGGDKYNELQTKFLGQTRDKLANTKSQDEQADLYHNAMGSAANGIKAAGYTPASFDAGVNLAIGLHPEMKRLLDPYVAQAHQDPNSIKGMVDQWISETPTGQRGEAEVRAENQEKRAQQKADEEAELHPFAVSEAASKATAAAQAAAGTTPITPYQQKILDIDKNRQDETNWYHRQEVSQGWKRLEDSGGGGGLTPNSREVTRRKQMGELDDLINEEAGLHKLRLQLGNALDPSRGGAVYVDEKGNMKPMDATSQGNDQTKAALMQEMKDRFGQATERVNDVIARKNQVATDLGYMSPESAGQATRQAQGAVRRGSQPQQAAPAGQGAKQLDRATAAQILKEAGGDKARARTIARQRDYTF